MFFLFFYLVKNEFYSIDKMANVLFISNTLKYKTILFYYGAAIYTFLARAAAKHDFAVGALEIGQRTSCL